MIDTNPGGERRNPQPYLNQLLHNFILFLFLWYLFIRNNEIIIIIIINNKILLKMGKKINIWYILQEDKKKKKKRNKQTKPHLPRAVHSSGDVWWVLGGGGGWAEIRGAFQEHRARRGSPRPSALLFDCIIIIFCCRRECWIHLKIKNKKKN